MSEIAELLTDQQPLSKTTFDCCGEHAVVAEIAEQRRHNILVCGLETHICVYQSVKSLLRAGYQVEVIEDAVSSRTQANRELGLARMQDAGARLTSLEMCLFELTGDAADPAFKQLLPLVK